MREIGGYFEFEKSTRGFLHQAAIALNCGRNCLAYLLESRQIKNIALPYFLCDSVQQVCKKAGVSIRYYHIQPNFMPAIGELADEEWLYVVNYYGQLSIEQLQQIVREHARVIVDNAQAYFAMPLPHVDTLYTCRKFFGVSDGAFLYTDTFLKRELEQDESFDRMHFVLGRFERRASEFLGEAQQNNRQFATTSIKKMSLLTQNMLRLIDYEEVKKTRTRNFTFLMERLGGENRISVHIPEGPFMYPFLLENAEGVRARLAAEQIYIPVLWPNVCNTMEKTSLEYHYATDLLPIPCDQRYNLEDMERICETLNKVKGKNYE